MFDQNARPKMHAFEGVGNDSIEEDSGFVVDETPDIVVYTPDTTAVDTVRTDTVSASPVSEEQAEMESQDTTDDIDE